MEVTVEKSGDILFINLNGRIDATNSHEFEQQVLPHLVEQKIIVIINLKGLDYISSAGLRSFLVIAKTSKNFEQNLSLCEMSLNIQEVFKITGFLKLFNIYSTKDVALANLKK